MRAFVVNDDEGKMTFAIVAAAVASSIVGSRPACSMRLEIKPDTAGLDELSQRSTVARFRVALQSFFTVVTGLLASRPGKSQGDSLFRVSRKASISTQAAALRGAR